MSNVESAFQRLVDANPERNVSALVASIGTRTAGHPKGSEHMTTKNVMDRREQPAGPTRSGRRRWIPAVAAAAAVIAVLAAIPFAFDGEKQFASMSEAEIATAFLAGEVEQPSELFSPDAVVEHRFLPTGDVDGWYAWRNAIGESNSDIQCSGDRDVHCTFAFQLEAAAAQDLGPYPFNSATFTFEDGLIIRWADLTNPNDVTRDIWIPFFDWLAPELHPRMYGVSDSGQTEPLFTDESLQLWRDQMEAFIAGASG
jgi:hypothetical protein